MIKKIFNIVTLAVAVSILAGWVAACSNDTNDNLTEQMSKTQLSETELLLSDYNNSLPSISETRSATTEELIVIAAKDAKGAYKGGKVGGRLGKYFGPHGAITGAIVGAVVIGGLASYIQYNKYQHSDQYQTQSGSSLSPSRLRLESFASAYAENKRLISHRDFTFGFNIGLDSCATSSGILHNKVLNRIKYHNGLQDHSQYLASLTEIEKYVLDSEDFIKEYNATFNDTDENRTAIISNEADRIINLFMSAVKNNATSASDLNNIIKTYTSTVRKSTSLTDIEKDSLLSAFAVMGYSYQYWSEKLAS